MAFNSLFFPHVIDLYTVSEHGFSLHEDLQPDLHDALEAFLAGKPVPQFGPGEPPQPDTSGVVIACK